MDSEERELQVRLAEVSADVQINLTIAFGFFAGFLALILTDEQIFYSLSSNDLTKASMFWVILVGSLASGLTLIYFSDRARTARKELEKLHHKS